MGVVVVEQWWAKWLEWSQMVSKHGSIRLASTVAATVVRRMAHGTWFLPFLVEDRTAHDARRDWGSFSVAFS